MPPLSNCEDTEEEPSSLHSSKHTHATWVQTTTLYSDGTTSIKQPRSKGVQPNGSPYANNHCSTLYEQSFSTISIHTLIRKLLQTNIPGTIMKFIANYIKGRRAYTTYSNHTSIQCQFKTGLSQGDVLSPTLFNIYTADLPPPRALVQVMSCADDIIITSTSMSAANKYIQPYMSQT